MKKGLVRIESTAWYDPIAQRIGGIGTCIQLYLIFWNHTCGHCNNLPISIWDSENLCKQTFGVVNDWLLKQVKEAMTMMVQFKWIEITEKYIRVVEFFNYDTTCKIAKELENTTSIQS